jgi:hypothetical protein
MFRRSLSSLLWTPITDPIANRIINRRIINQWSVSSSLPVVRAATVAMKPDASAEIVRHACRIVIRPQAVRRQVVRMTRRLRNLRGSLVRRRSHIHRRTGSRSVHLRRRLSSRRHRCINLLRHRRHQRYTSLLRLRQLRRSINLLRRRSRMSGRLTIVRGASRSKSF